MGDKLSDSIAPREPQEQFPADTVFDALPKKLRRKCCADKGCGNTTLYRSEHAVKVDGEWESRYGYRRASNDDWFFLPDTLEATIDNVNDPIWWPVPRTV